MVTGLCKGPWAARGQVGVAYMIMLREYSFQVLANNTRTQSFQSGAVPGDGQEETPVSTNGPSLLQGRDGDVSASPIPDALS